MLNLTGKKALITGATGGIGGQIAKSLSEAGASVVISGTREEKLKELAAQIKGEVHILPCNLSDVNEVEELFEKAEEIAGG
jgi:3-oxoacyl-[acyl-carrier protein] reductase